MWKCPKCEKEFKNENQSHFCGEGPTEIDAYIDGQPLPLELIVKIALWNYETENHHGK